MTLHIFNPEHDIALASGLANFTAPHAGRQLRHDLGFLPALWASEGDIIMVDDVDQARRSLERLTHRLHTLQQTQSLLRANSEFTPGKLRVYSGQNFEVEPWGWNSALRALLLRRGVSEELMPTLAQLDVIRQLSHRREAAALLPKLRVEGTVGEAFECHSLEQMEMLLTQYGQLVLKAPWSSSGRGLRFVSTANDIHRSKYITGWFQNIVQAQGCVMAEPYYNKVKDFGMEFHSDGEGHVTFLGLSLFHTANGAYTGNILATERTKREMISRYIPVDLLDVIQEKICQELGAAYNGKYQGPFGVDMMVVGGTSFQLHPCVEINLRRTMGHVALSLSPNDDDLHHVMRIEYAENCYQLKIERL